jgi:hypothetical protein
MKFKAILRNTNILNIVLMAIVAAFAAYSVYPTLEMKVKYALPAAKTVAVTEDKESDELKIPSLTQYTSISDENLFHPERRIPPEKKEEVPLPKPEFVLYGTMISDDLSLAYLEDMKAPRNTPGRGKRQVALKKGDSMSGFILKEIDTDKITMVRGEEKLIVAMNDPQKPKVREVAAPTTAPPATASKPQAAPVTTPAQRQRESRRAPSTSQAPAQTAPSPVAAPQPVAPQQPSQPGTPPQAVFPDIKKSAPSNQYRPSGTGGGLLFPNR